MNRKFLVIGMITLAVIVVGVIVGFHPDFTMASPKPGN